MSIFSISFFDLSGILTVIVAIHTLKHCKIYVHSGIYVFEIFMKRPKFLVLEYNA